MSPGLYWNSAPTIDCRSPTCSNLIGRNDVSHLIPTPPRAAWDDSLDVKSFFNRERPLGDGFVVERSQLYTE